MAETNDHVHLLGLTQNPNHLLGGFDGVRERNRARSTCVKHGLFAKHPEDAEANTAALNHQVAADDPVLCQVLELGQGWVVSAEVGIRGDYGRNPAGFCGRADGLAQAVGPEVEIMVAEGGGVVTHLEQELQLAASLADGCAKGSPHAVVTHIKH